MSEHTPGPWKCERLIDNDGNPYATSYLAHIDIGPCMIWAPVGNAEQEANARLIAAAPETAAERDKLKEINKELLDALVYVMFRHVPFSNKADYANRARAVVAKATGVTP